MMRNDVIVFHLEQLIIQVQVGKWKQVKKWRNIFKFNWTLYFDVNSCQIYTHIYHSRDWKVIHMPQVSPDRLKLFLRALMTMPILRVSKMFRKASSIALLCTVIYLCSSFIFQQKSDGDEFSVAIAVRLHKTLELAGDKFYMITCGKAGFQNTR